MKTTNPASDESSQLIHLRQLVTEARSQLAEAEAEFTREKSRVTAVHAGLFRQLRGHYQKRDRLRLAVDYRQKFLDSFVRDSVEEVEQAEKELQQAKAQLDEEYEKMAAAAEKQNALTAGQEAELPHIWQKLVKLYLPASLAEEPGKRRAYHQLAAAIQQAKHSGDTDMLRKIAEEPESFQLQKGWAPPVVTDVQELAQLNRLLETLKSEIAAVAESLKELRERPDFALCQQSDTKPGALDELAAERAKQLELEISELEKHAEELAQEILKLSGQASH